jgi:quinol monooxygenase YgiN
MITRIVKMHFREDALPEFLDLFNQISQEIRGFSGCKELKLLIDKKNKGIVFTYSKWESEEQLNDYRHSAFFSQTWKRTKSLFAHKAEAWTVEEY